MDARPTGTRLPVPHRRRRVRVAVTAGWVAVAVAWVLRLRTTGTTPTDSLQDLVDTLGGAWWAVPAFVVVSTVRPLVLFPASLLTIAAGVLFGAVVGVPVAVVAANLSAVVAYGAGRTFSPERVAGTEGATGLLARWSGRLRQRSFATVMVLRLALVPYDLVNYLAGFLRIELVPFVTATALGSLPATIAFVLAGASLERLDAGVSGLDPVVLAASASVFVVSLLVARVVQRRTGATAAPPPDAAAGPG